MNRLVVPCRAVLLVALAMGAAPAARAQLPLSPHADAGAYVAWIDPTEHGFRVEVPAGWQVIGGTRWKGPTDARQWVRARSPDGRLQVFLDDPEILPRTAPNAAYARSGLREGAVVQMPSGPTLLQRFQTGGQFAQAHAGTACPGARITHEADDATLSARMTQDVRPFAQRMGVTADVSTGEAGFLCGSGVGFVAATTVCIGDAGFGEVNAFREHVNVAFFRAVDLPDPAGLLEGTGRSMRHVKLFPDRAVDEAALRALVLAAYRDMRARVAAEAAE